MGKIVTKPSRREFYFPCFEGKKLGKSHLVSPPFAAKAQAPRCSVSNDSGGGGGGGGGGEGMMMYDAARRRFGEEGGSLLVRFSNNIYNLIKKCTLKLEQKNIFRGNSCISFSQILFCRILFPLARAFFLLEDEGCLPSLPLSSLLRPTRPSSYIIPSPPTTNSLALLLLLLLLRLRRHAFHNTSFPSPHEKISFAAFFLLL